MRRTETIKTTATEKREGKIEGKKNKQTQIMKKETESLVISHVLKLPINYAAIIY